MRAEAIDTAPPLRRGITVWFAVLGGIPAWAVHLVFTASFVEFTYNWGGAVWPLHLATALTAAATIAAMLLALRLVRATGDDESNDTAPGRLHFLGLFGLLVGAINLLLILLEGVYVVFLHTGRA